MQQLQSLALAFECRQSRSAACSSFLHARAVLCVAAVACDRTAVKTPALVSGSVGAETARSVGRAACSSFLHARAVLCVAAIACDRTAVKTLALVRGSVGAETARSVGRAACSSFLHARAVLCVAAIACGLSGCRDRPSACESATEASS